MEKKYNIGIYIKEDSATVTALNNQGRDKKIIDCFSVTIEKDDTLDSAENVDRLVSALTKTCNDRKIVLAETEVNVAIDCSMYMQHNIKSEFSEPRQIDKTIRFDTEEAFANDISGFALCYTVTSKDQTGSNVSVFTAEKKLLNEILKSLQSYGVDPVIIQPDVICLSSFIFSKFPAVKTNPNIFAILSEETGYLLTSSPSKKNPTARTFFLNPGQDRTSLVKRQIMTTSAALNDNTAAASAKIFDINDSIDPARISPLMPAEIVDLRSFYDPEQIPEPNRPDIVAFAISFGAAAPAAEKGEIVDFRQDFNVYQGTKIRILKTAKVLSICASICLIALGIFYQQKLISANKPRKAARAEFNQFYLQIFPDTDADKVPGKLSQAISKLEREKRRLQNYSQGRLDEQGTKTIPAQLTLLIDAFNNYIENHKDLEVDSINITGKNIILNASTSSKDTYIKLLDEIDDVGIERIQETEIPFKNGRQSFKLTLKL